MTFHIPALALAFAAAFGLAGCSTKKPETALEGFDLASGSLRKGAYQLAIDQYRELLDQHPFSEYTENAEFEIARALYLKNDCPEAVGSLADFQRGHPTSPHMAEVGYLLGQCYERQMRPPDRDQSSSQHAHAYYLAVMQQYPESPFARLAREQMDRCRSSLARHELLVARFYRKRDHSKACEIRLLDLVNRFGETDQAAEALFELGQIYTEAGEKERAALALAAVVRNHPHHELVAAAGERLAKLDAGKDLPAGDPMVVLRGLTGRNRRLALTQTVEVPPLDNSTLAPGFGPALDPMGQNGPLGY